MTPTTEQFLRSVINRNWRPAFEAMASVPSVELFHAVAALDPVDRTALRSARMGGPPSLREVYWGSRINYAIDVVTNGAIPSGSFLGLQYGDKQAADIYLGRKPPHAHPEALPFWNDLTGWLPPANPRPSQITDADVQRAAEELDVEVAAVRAVAEVESRNQGFENGRPIIRYELHKFRNGEQGVWAGVGDGYDRTHPHLSQRNLAAGEHYHIGRQGREYSLMHAAMILRDPSGRRRYADAWKAASWGRFQVMGFNYAIAGWGNIEGFVAAMYTSEGNHLQAFLGYVNAHNLVRHLRNHNWAAFALGYNGDQSQVPEERRVDYPGLLERAYNRHRQREQQQGAAPRQPAGAR
jgi:hypothetical protein